MTKLYPNRSLSELGELAKRLSAQDNLVAILAGYDGQGGGIATSEQVE